MADNLADALHTAIANAHVGPAGFVVPATRADKILGTVMGTLALHGYGSAGHEAEAQQAVVASTYQRQKWGETEVRDDLRSAQWEMERAKVHALLNIADAIREQTEALHLGGIRDDLSSIEHALRNGQEG